MNDSEHLIEGEKKSKIESANGVSSLLRKKNQDYMEKCNGVLHFFVMTL